LVLDGGAGFAAQRCIHCLNAVAGRLLALAKDIFDRCFMIRAKVDGPPPVGPLETPSADVVPDLPAFSYVALPDFDFGHAFHPLVREAMPAE
jgi:hypothetical protein